jgi:acyl-coenzyme A thioesterase 9
MRHLRLGFETRLPWSRLVLYRNSYLSGRHLSRSAQFGQSSCLLRYARLFTTQPEDESGRPSKRPRDSFIEHVLPFATDQKLRENFVSSFGQVRFGLILEEMDSLAGRVGYKHAEGLTFPKIDVLHPSSSNRQTTIVTATCDRITLLRPIQIDRNLIMKGMVTWAGRSSMEVRIEVESINPGGKPEPHLVAHFVMVSRQKDKNVAAVVPRVVPVSEKEQMYYRLAASNAQRRKEAAAMSLSTSPPTQDEVNIIHQIFTQTHLGGFSADSSQSELQLFQNNLLMIHKTARHSVQWTHPQNRNIHGHIFGGFLMRQAYELAFVTCRLFTKGKEIPRFLAMDDIYFIKPVLVGSILSLSSRVVYTSTSVCEKEIDTFRLSSAQTTPFPLVQVQVQADVANSQTTTSETTNVFHFTFAQAENIMRVVPNTYSEAMDYLQARRRIVHEKKTFEELSLALADWKGMSIL